MGQFQGEKLEQHGMSMERRENRIAQGWGGGGRGRREGEEEVAEVGGEGAGKKSWETCGESRTRRLKLYLIFWKQSM